MNVRRVFFRHRALASLFALGAMVGACGIHEGPGSPIAAERLNGADSSPSDWLSHGRDYAEQRFSPLTEINDATAKDVGLSWYADIGMGRGAEATPIVIDGVMYITTAWSNVRAFDAATGKPLWQFDPEVKKDILVRACCDAVNRGVAVWGDKVFVGALDGRLIALDRETGKPAWSVQTTPTNGSYTVTGAPRVIDGMVIIGNGGAEFGVRGFVAAYAADTGKRIWRFYTVPGDPRRPDGEISDTPLAAAAKTWSGDAWWKMKAGGGTAWDAFAFDPKLDLLYIGTGNGSPWSRKERSAGTGDNLYLSSILAVRPKTGELVWHYQVTPGDEWDYTATQSIVLADLEIAGQKRSVLMQAPKNGFFYVLDRATGKLISAEKYVPVNWADRIDPKTGRPVENPAARYSETGKPFFQTPGPLGGHNWPPMAFSPRTGLVYIPAQEIAKNYAPRADFRMATMGYNTGTDGLIAGDPAQSPIKQAKGYLLAWDPRTQKEVWRAPRDTFGNGGVLATAGNLVLQGTGTGDFKIMRADTGQELLSIPVQAGIIAPPITYAVEGRQFIAVLAGCGGVFGSACKLVEADGRKPNLDRLLVFALGGKVALPAEPGRMALTLDPPTGPIDPAHVARGTQLYSQYCTACHGASGVSTGNQPDLRYSPLLGDDMWYQVLLEGALKENGMADFSPVLTRDDADAIRQYLTGLARKRKSEAKPKAAGQPDHSS